MRDMSEFQEGALVTIGILFRIHGSGVECKDLIREMSLYDVDCSKLDVFDKENLKALNDYENLGLKGL